VKTRLERSAAKAKRLIRRRLRGKQGEKKVLDLTDKNFKHKAVSVDPDGVLSISDEGISNLSKAYRRLLGDPDSLKPSMKGRSGKGIVGEDGTLSGQNPEMAVLWEANGMNSLPVLVDDADLDALVDAGWETISRGHGGADNAEDYLTDPLRFLPGAGGEASGKGEYWARARDGRDWSSWMSATSTTATVGVLPPKARRMDVDRRSKESDGNKTISDIFDLVRTGYSGDEITKVEPSELAKQIRAEFEAKGLTAESPHERWETEVGQLWQRLLESAERGNSKSVNVMLLLNKIAKTHRGENLIAPVLGYDTISTTDGRGVELVMNRGAVIALDETLMQKGALEWLDKAREISLQDRRS
jgi:hypothetical protein